MNRIITRDEAARILFDFCVAHGLDPRRGVRLFDLQNAVGADTINPKGDRHGHQQARRDAAPHETRQVQEVLLNLPARERVTPMRYNVLEEFDLPGGKAEPVHVEAGTVWIPAETGVPKHEVERLERERKIELIAPEVVDDAAAGEGAPKRRRSRH